MKKNAGFTLIELVAVMVILAILAVVAIPQFVDLRTEARAAATAGVAGSLSSASALNYAREMANATNGLPIANCDEVGTLLQGGDVPTGYSIADLAVGPNATVSNCVLTGPGPTTANFVAIGVN